MGRMDCFGNNCMRQFYIRLLNRSRIDVIIVFLFLTFIILFQLSVPHILTELNNVDNNDAGDRQSENRRLSQLSHQEALWEIQMLTVERNQKDEQIKALKKVIDKLNEEPPEIKQPGAVNKTTNSGVPYYSFDPSGAYSANGMFDNDAVLGGFRAELIKEFNAIGDYITKHYNANQKGGIFRKVIKLNSNPGNMTVNHFRMGVYRYVPQKGVEYQLYFEDPSSDDVLGHYLYKVSIYQPAEQPQSYSVEHVNSRRKIINIVVALKKRLDTFKEFLIELAKLKSSTDIEFHLTIVYFGQYGLKRAYQLIKDARNYGLTNVKLIEVTQEEFSRGHGIQRGIEKWKNGNDVMFVCDVDMIIRRRFLERCTLYTGLGKAVYYPIAFSLHNPKVVRFFSNFTTPRSPEEEQKQQDDILTISKQKGSWRDFGYGMLCTHRSDFFKVGGYRQWTRNNKYDKYWGNEDVDLYERFVRHEKLSVIRAPDPDIFHRWHLKHCPGSLHAKTLKQCQTTLVANEGSHEHLGLLHYEVIYKNFIALNGSLSMKDEHNTSII